MTLPCILEYMIEKLGIEATKSPEMCVQLYKDYGTTLAGLRVWSFIIVTLHNEQY